MTPRLRAEYISVRYDGVLALTDVDVQVHEGELVGLIGPNGAGKTTFIDAISGFVRAAGRVELDTVDISRLPVDRRARLGLRRTWQSGELFHELTVRENLAVAAAPQPPRELVTEAVRGRRSGNPAVEDALALLCLESVENAFPDQLSQAQRKLVGIGRAIAARPRVVCLDEPAAGLDASETRMLGDILRQLAASGIGLLLVDHDMGLVLTVCDNVVVLDFGRVIARALPDDVRRDHRVVEAYLGSAARELVSATEMNGPAASSNNDE